MNYKKPIPQDLQDKVVEQHKNGAPCKAICESLNISRRKFYRILDENNITSKLSHIDDNSIDYIPVGTYSTSQMSRITLNSVQICADLAKHGCHPNKTNKLLFPYDSIEPDLYRHFIRGFFDGDGSIDATLFRITSNKEILIEIQNILMLTCKLRRTKLKDYPHKEIEIYDLSYGGRLQLERIYNYLYQDSELYLERKKNIFKRTISSPSA